MPKNALLICTVHFDLPTQRSLTAAAEVGAWQDGLAVHPPFLQWPGAFGVP
jgi:hypothetical protein